MRRRWWCLSGQSGFRCRLLHRLHLRSLLVSYKERRRRPTRRVRAASRRRGACGLGPPRRIAAADAAAASPHNLNAVALQLLLGACSGDPVGHNKRPRRSNSSPPPSPYRCPSTRGLLPAKKRHRVLVVTKQGQSAATDTQCARQLTSCRASRRRKLLWYPMLSDPVES